jgi:dephospho-CoA kinase
MQYLLGLTGSIGMGKTTTSKMFRDAGIAVWDADAAVHKLYSAGGAAVAAIAAHFPAAVHDDAVSRTALKGLIAENPDTLGEIEKIVHPLVASDRAQFLADNPGQIVLFDMPLLFETQAESWLDMVIVVSCPPEIQRARVLAREGMTPEQFELILSKQMPDATKRAKADLVIETETLDATRAAVQTLVTQLRKDHG